MSERLDIDEDLPLRESVTLIKGRLWMGGRPREYTPWDFVVSCEGKEPPTDGILAGYYKPVLYAPMIDHETFVPDKTMVDIVVRSCREAMSDEKEVLIHCTAGLNRSAYMVGMVLMHYYGMSASEAINLMRERHDPYVLNNKGFERLLRGSRR